MLEQELASIIKFTLDKAGNPSPYYYKVPEHFMVPSAYFPTPEIMTRGDTFLTYGMDYTWLIKFFHKTSHEAYELGLQVLTAIKGNRNIIPLIGTDGEEISGEAIRTGDPQLKILDDGAAQLQIEWTSRRPYNAEECDKIQGYEVEYWKKSEAYTERVISSAYAEAIEQYVIKQSEQPE